MKTTFKLFVKCIHKNKDRFQQIPEEENLKTKISMLLEEEGYTFVIGGMKE